MRLAYYPGCSLDSSSEAYDLSVRAVCDRLGIELCEVDDWNCCGATEAATLSQLPAQALVARNLARADASCEEIVAPCAACYLNLKKVDKLFATSPAFAAKMAQVLEAGGASYTAGRLRVRHLLDVLVEMADDAIVPKIERPLTGLRVAPYYGCQVVRPRDAVDDPEHPTMLDTLLKQLGATVVDYPLKAHCCGGHMTQISAEMSDELIRRLLHNADEYQADVIACLCPMCQLNLDAYQRRVNNSFNTDYSLPPVFFTQLIGLALGIDEGTLGLGREIVDATPVLRAKLGEGSVQGDSAAAPRRPRRDAKELPMPGHE